MASRKKRKRAPKPLVADVYYRVLVAIEKGGQDGVGAALHAGSKNWRVTFSRMRERGWLRIVGRTSSGRGLTKGRPIHMVTERGKLALEYARSERVPERAE